MKDRLKARPETNLTNLNREESARWTELVSTVHDQPTGHAAFETMLREFPRLKEFDGIRFPARTKPSAVTSIVASAGFMPEPAPGESLADYIVRETKTRNYPTSDAFAEWLWRWSNSGEVGPSKAERIMREAGYMPFMGFPLQRIPQSHQEHMARFGW